MPNNHIKMTLLNGHWRHSVALWRLFPVEYPWQSNIIKDDVHRKPVHSHLEKSRNTILPSGHQSTDYLPKKEYRNSSPAPSKVLPPAHCVEVVPFRPVSWFQLRQHAGYPELSHPHTFHPVVLLCISLPVASPQGYGTWKRLLNIVARSKAGSGLGFRA